ncbi:LmeA family phospholipid-binding protein [Streptomyces mesophilus]|uniref:LmeA family phospholipid-binding protein n=1 Tax=Streptomyces mesophilus TaxID=1775132 RepID=UPI003333B382
MRLRTTLITLGVLSALALAGDLAAEQIAENIATDKVSDRLPGDQGSVDVDIAGFPFLTQAVSGQFDEIEITVKDAADPTGSSAVTLPSATLTAHDVRVEGTSSAVADRIDGEAIVPYSAIADGLQRQYPGQGDVELAPVTGGANRVRLTQGGEHLIARLTGQRPDLVFTPEVEGAPPQMVTLATGPIPVDVTGVTLDDDGVRLHIAARSVSLG